LITFEAEVGGIIKKTGSSLLISFGKILCSGFKPLV
jgi:hypothetical protein